MNYIKNNEETSEENTIDTNNEETIIKSKMPTNIRDLMKKTYYYPEPSDPELQQKLYSKREFHYLKIKPRPDSNNKEEITKYRDNICSRNFSLHEHQISVSNFINPNTPYKGLLLFHGLGSGKCLLGNTMVYINNISNRLDTIWARYNNNNNIYTDNEGGEWINIHTRLLVNSYHNNTIIQKPIVRLYREHIKSYIKTIEFDNNNNNISCTMIHRLLTPNGWSNNLSIGDMIGTYENNILKWTRIKAISIIKYDGYVYDLEIKDTHNYVANNIVCHNTCAGVAIAEKFKNQVQRYNTKIYILVSGPLIKENWKAHLVKCTGNTYIQQTNGNEFINDAEKKKREREAQNNAMQYYKFLSYKSFYKRVLGEKIVESKTTKGSKVSLSYRKNEEGEFERDISIDRIYNLNNSIIIVDEAHNLTGNSIGDALNYIIKKSTNLRIVLLTGTPMKNLADDIIPLLNFIRPQNSPIERDKVFNSHKNYLMDFVDGGLEYLKKMASGYVSHVRGGDPYIFATKIDKGVIPNNMSFVKVIQCYMLPLQQNIYDEINKNMEMDDEEIDDNFSLDKNRKTEAVANCIFPGLSNENKKIVGLHGVSGLTILRNQLKSYRSEINKKIKKDLLKITTNTEDDNFLYISDNKKTITGKIFNIKYLKYFSIKFYTALKKLNRLVYSKKGSGLAFIYSNLVRVGIEIFEQILIQNGYLEYTNKGSYNISDDTVCYFCGKKYSEHHIKNNIKSNIKSNIEPELEPELEPEIQPIMSEIDNEENQDEDLSESSSDYEINSDYENTHKIPSHMFRPATFITLTGMMNDDTGEFINEEKKHILDNVFNSLDNSDGKYIKFVLGSKVMNEGISLKNIKEVHILDVYFNLGRVDQVIGRGIRQCSHYSMLSETNFYPEVKVYKYVVSLRPELNSQSNQITRLSSEENMYRKAELKYTLIKKVERALKTVAIDCPLNMNGNIFKEEIKANKHCNEKDKPKCPIECDNDKCDYVCDNSKLNYDYYDPDRQIYKMIDKDKLDYSTFNSDLLRNEIDYIKNKIKELYIFKYEYTLDHIIFNLKKIYEAENKDHPDEFFIYKALDELIPITENDFNTFTDIIIDKYNKQGYLIYIGNYYIFQPFDKNRNISMYERTNIDIPQTNKLSLFNYIKNNSEFSKLQNIIDQEENINTNTYYDFESTKEYYDDRNEFEYVGIIDKELKRRKTKSDETNDVFKIRVKKPKMTDKLRATGIPSLKGSVCATSKNKEYLENILYLLDKEINKLDNKDKHKQKPKHKDIPDEFITRTDICEQIKTKMLFLEKYNEKNITYVMIPANHLEYKFPYNLLSRVDFIKNQITNQINFKLDIKTIEGKDKTTNMPIYKIIIKHNDILKNHIDFLNKLNCVKTDNEWTILID
jgi:superfamily II DNA or RNA helicase